MFRSGSRHDATTRRRLLTLGAIAVLATAPAACSDDDGSIEDAIDEAADAAADELGDAADELGDALGGDGGGGTLVFDGEEIPIDGVTCMSSGDDFSVGTVSDNGFRVFIDSSSTGVPNAQVLDADMRQWSPRDRGESIEIGDGTYSSPATTYFDIRDSDSEVEVSFTVECP